MNQHLFTQSCEKKLVLVSQTKIQVVSIIALHFPFYILDLINKKSKNNKFKKQKNQKK